VTSEFKIMLSVTDILKLSPTFLIMWTSILRMWTVTSKSLHSKQLRHATIFVGSILFP